MRYPGAVIDPDTGEWISDAEVAEIAYTAFASTPDAITARLVVRRVKDARYRDALFPVWRYHPFFTNTDLPVEQADITHRHHAIIETVFADLIDGPLAHLPSGRFGANSAWILCAAIAHNLLRAAGVLAGDQHTRARGSTLRRRIITVPARLARPQRRPILHLPTHWPWSKHWLTLWHNTIGYSPPLIRDSLTTRRKARPEHHRKSWADQQPPHAHSHENQDHPTQTPTQPGPSVGWPGGIAPPGSHRSRRDSLPSPGSCHPGHQTRATEGVHVQCANMRGYRAVIPRQHSMAFLSARNRLYFLRIQRTR